MDLFELADRSAFFSKKSENGVCVSGFTNRRIMNHGKLEKKDWRETSFGLRKSKERN